MGNGKELPEDNQGISIADRIAKILRAVEERISEEINKATVADFIRLIQLHKEYESDGPWQIESTWIEPLTGGGSEGK